MIRKIGLLGASGKMGLEIASALNEEFSFMGDSLELCDAISSSGRLTSIEGIEVRGMDDEPREPVHLWIDFSRPAGTLALLEKIETPVVIGTTGFSDVEVAKIRAYAERHPVLLCPNTSPGMALMAKMLRSVPVPASFAAVLDESHHRFKKDSPSGTAKMLLAVLQAQGRHDVTVHATRAGSIVGTHTVRFIADGEELTLTHTVSNRRIFATGALRGALFLARQTTPRIYTVDDWMAAEAALDKE